MLTIARVLGELIENYVRASTSGNRDCRLLVPGLTRDISKQVHEHLIGKGISSYLVIGDDDQPSETSNLIRPVGLTSRRIGSFVAIAVPGQLIHIQDSIRGSGGTIRSTSFSEEWPWIDNGGEAFRFDGPVLNRLVRDWSSDADEQSWIREFILDGLLPSTRATSRRGPLLLEDILGRFKSSLYPEISDIRQKLLFHSGVPLPADSIPQASKLILSSSKLCQKIVERCQKDENVRDQARDIVMEIIPSNERADVRVAIDVLLDGVGRSFTSDLGILGFHGCWGQDKDGSVHWRKLHADRLAALFNVKEREKAQVSYNVHCERAVIAHNGKKLATFTGQVIDLDIEYEVPAQRFASHTWEVQVLNRQKVVAQQVLTQARGQISLSFNTADSTAKYSRKVPLKVALLEDRNIDADARLDMHLCGPDRPAFAVVEPGFEVVDATAVTADEAPDKKISSEVPVHVFLFSYDAEKISMQDEDGRDVPIFLTKWQGIFRSSRSVDVTADQSGRVVRVCSFDELDAVICFESANVEKGEFTLEDELRTVIPVSKEERLKELSGLFEGKTTKPYRRLGHIDEPARRRIAFAELITRPIGWHPLLTNLLDPGNGSAPAGSLGEFVNFLGEIDGAVFNSLRLPDDALALLKAYADARDKVLSEIRSRVDDEGLNQEHPLYATHPFFFAVRVRQDSGSLGRFPQRLLRNTGLFKTKQ